MIFGTSLALVNRLNLIMSGRTLTDVNRLGEHMSLRPVKVPCFHVDERAIGPKMHTASHYISGLLKRNPFRVLPDL